MNNGWVKLYRQMQFNELWNSDKPFDERSAWVDLILMVSRKKQIINLPNGSKLTISSGQIFISLRKLADKWHWDKGQVTRFLETLESMGSASLDKSPFGTIITLTNYESFQKKKLSRETGYETECETPLSTENKTVDNSKSETASNRQKTSINTDKSVSTKSHSETVDNSESETGFYEEIKTGYETGYETHNKKYKKYKNNNTRARARDFHYKGERKDDLDELINEEIRRQR